MKAELLVRDMESQEKEEKDEKDTRKLPKKFPKREGVY